MQRIFLLLYYKPHVSVHSLRLTQALLITPNPSTEPSGSCLVAMNPPPTSVSQNPFLLPTLSDNGFLHATLFCIISYLSRSTGQMVQSASSWFLTAACGPVFYLGEVILSTLSPGASWMSLSIDGAVHTWPLLSLNVSSCSPSASFHCSDPLPWGHCRPGHHLQLFFFFSSPSLLLPTHLPPPSCTHAQSCNPMDFSPPDSSVRGFFQARILEWVAISFSH